jgi:hypothetical protein
LDHELLGFVAGGVEAVLGREAAAALPALRLPPHLRCGDAGGGGGAPAPEEALEALPAVVRALFEL